MHNFYCHLEYALAHLVLYEIISNPDSGLEVACNSCHKTFESPRKLAKHTKQVHIKKHICAKCGRRFGLSADLKRHQRRVHRSGFDQIEHHCPIHGCTARFPDRHDNLLRHLRTVHRVKLASDRASREYARSHDGASCQ